LVDLLSRPTEPASRLACRYACLASPGHGEERSGLATACIPRHSPKTSTRTPKAAYQAVPTFGDDEIRQGMLRLPPDAPTAPPRPAHARNAAAAPPGDDMSHANPPRRGRRRSGVACSAVLRSVETCATEGTSAAHGGKTSRSVSDATWQIGAGRRGDGGPFRTHTTRPIRVEPIGRTPTGRSTLA